MGWTLHLCVDGLISIGGGIGTDKFGGVVGFMVVVA